MSQAFGACITTRKGPNVVISDDTVCYVHSDRTASVGCQRCNRPICASCMVQASVGFHCRGCLKQTKQKTVGANEVFGASRPQVIVALIVANVAVFFITQSQGSVNSLQTDGLLYGPMVRHLGEWWRIITSGFLHGGIMHLGFNMFALWVFGNPVHEAVGRLRFSLIYAGGLLGGASAVLVFDHFSPTIGASGATLGLAGGLAAILWARGVNITQTPLAGLFLLNIGLPLLMRGISFWGHVGGIVGGFIVGWLISWLPDRFGQSQAVTLGAVGCALVAMAGLGIYGPIAHPIFSF